MIAAMPQASPHLVRNIAISQLLSLGVFAATVAALGPAQAEWKGLLIFQLIVLLLCDEAWQWCLAVPTLLGAVLSTLKNPRDTTPARPGKLTMRLSACVLLVLPHLLYALAYIIDQALGGKLSEQCGVEFGAALFAGSYAGMVALWLMAELWLCLPFSMGLLFENRLLSPEEHRQEPPPPSAVPPSAEHPHGTDDMLPEHRQALANQLAAGEAVLSAMRPLLSATNRYARRDVLWGTACVPAVLLMLAMAAHGVSIYSSMSSPTGPLVIIITACALALIFGCLAWHLLHSPQRWGNKLRRVSYAITGTHVYIFEGESMQRFRLSPTLQIIADEIAPGQAINILLAEADMPAHAARFLFGQQAQAVRMADHIAPTRPLPGLFHVPASLLALLRQQCAKAAEPPTRQAPEESSTPSH